MPDVQLRFPRFMFARTGFGHGTAANDDTMADLIAATVAEFFDCDDYDGHPLSLTPSKVDVYMIPYNDGLMRTQGAPVFLQIIGYDYPTRMANRKDRLTSIKGVLNDFLLELNIETRFVPDLDYEADNDLIGVTFIPIQDDCYV